MPLARHGKGDVVKSFEIAVACNAGGSKHEHLVVVSASDGEVAQISNTGKVKLRYICPISGEPRFMRFIPPVGIRRPFAIESVD
jgi:hypothetical protein